MEHEAVSVRDRIDGDLGSLPLAGAIEKLLAEVREKRVRQVARAQGGAAVERGAAHEY
jgi:threonyl-tRNA synthetase